jgi:hypothetical protein
MYRDLLLHRHDGSDTDRYPRFALRVQADSRHI